MELRDAQAHDELKPHALSQNDALLVMQLPLSLLNEPQAFNGLHGARSCEEYLPFSLVFRPCVLPGVYLLEFEERDVPLCELLLLLLVVLKPISLILRVLCPLLWQEYAFLLSAFLHYAFHDGFPLSLVFHDVQAHDKRVQASLQRLAVHELALRERTLCVNLPFMA